MESFNSLCLKWWEGFYASFQNSCTMTCISENGALDVKHGEMSIMLGVGGSETSNFLDSCGIPDIDIMKFNHVLCRIETLCMPKVILMYEQYKSSLHLESKNNGFMFDSFQIMDDISGHNDIANSESTCQSDARVSHIRIISANDEYSLKTEAVEASVSNNVKESTSPTTLVQSQEKSIPLQDRSSSQTGDDTKESIQKGIHSEEKINYREVLYPGLNESKEKLSELSDYTNNTASLGKSGNELLFTTEKSLSPSEELEPKHMPVTSKKKFQDEIHEEISSRQNIDNDECKQIRRSSRQIRVSSRFAEDSEAIRKLIKPQPVDESESLQKKEAILCVCSICKAIFSDAGSLRTHWKSHKENKFKKRNQPFFCCKCHSSFSSYQKVKKHQCLKAGSNKMSSSDFEKENAVVKTDNRLDVNVDTKATECSNGKENIEINGHIEFDSDIKYSTSSGRIHFCNICPLRFLTVESLKVHLRTHGKKPYDCNECGRQFSQQKAFLYHSRRLHNKTKLLQCQHCSRTFLDSHSLERHTQIHKGKKSFFCEICGKGFYRHQSLLKHQRLHEKDHEFQCQVCRKSFLDKRSLDGHLSVHTGEKPHVCEICGKRFRIERGLINHSRLHDKSSHLKCDQCPKTFIEKRSLEAHQRAHSGIKPFMCNVCGKAFRRELGLLNHSRLHDHSRAIKCDVCNKSFVDKWGMMKHKTIHTGEKPFTCDVCGKSFRIKKGLLDHVKLHDKALQYKCELCPRTFVEKRKLDIHIRAHRGEKAYVCDQCGQRFMNSMTLKVHKRRHTGEKPYKCSFCDKAFNQQGTLIAHERYHKGEKPYVCEVCGDGYVTKSHLTIHRRKHFNDRPYKCEQCDYAAFTFSLLRIHMLKHSSEKPFKCHLCSSAFKRPHHLDVHMRTHLGSEKPFHCQYCNESFDSNKKFTTHLASHEIVVVAPHQTAEEILTTEGLGEVAYDIVLFS